MIVVQIKEFQLIKKVLLCLFMSLIIHFSLVASTPSKRNEIRESFFKASYDKFTFNGFQSLLKEEVFTNKNTYRGYLGAFSVLKAKYNGNIIQKLKLIGQGTQELDKAIKNDPDNLELRFLRFSVEFHVPGILLNKSHLTVDRNFIMNNAHKATALSLSDNFVSGLLSFLKYTEYFTTKELDYLSKKLS